MYKKEFLSVFVLVILFVCPVISADDGENEEVSKKKDEQTIEKKRFLPWLLKDFKITQKKVELSVTKEKADYYNLYGVDSEKILSDAKIILSLYSSRDSIFFSRRIPSWKTENRSSYGFRFTIASHLFMADNKCNVGDSDVALAKLLKAFPVSLGVLESYTQLHGYEYLIEKRPESPVQVHITEKLYVFPVEKAEMERFMSLVPKDQFTAEVYDGFVVLHRIYSKEEAEKRKDFLLNTNGQSKGLWNMVDKYEGRRIRYNLPSKL